MPLECLFQRGIPERRFNLVAIKVPYEATVVGLSVLRPGPWCPGILAPGKQGGFVKRIDCRATRRNKSDMSTVARRCRCLILGYDDPEFWESASECDSEFLFFMNYLNVQCC